MIFYQASLQQIFSFLDSSSLGLTEKEARNRYKEASPNELQETKNQGPWLLLLDQFKDVMILILAGAALLSSWIGDQTDTYIILVILILNAFLGFIQEYRAEKAITSLKKLSETQSQVLRSGKQVRVPSRQLVMGDVVILEAGNLVPADLRFLETYSLKIGESSLTGESVPSEKVSKVLDSSSLSLGDQVNMGFKGTLVTQGRAKGMVVAIGMDTQMGKIAQLLEQRSPMTPLQHRMQSFGKVISLVILGICTAVFLAGLARGEELFSMLLLSVSLAVAAIPEALPALITIALSLGAKRLAKQNALVRKLPAVESLGSITYLCTDKTGTITQNKLSVSRWESASQARIMENFSNLELGLALCHDALLEEEGLPQGEPTEMALLTHLVKEIGIENYHTLVRSMPREEEIPFDPTRKRMSTVHRVGKRYLVLCKGAPESIASILKNYKIAKNLVSSGEIWAQEGERVLAFAGKLMDQLPLQKDLLEIESQLNYYGKVGLIDPPREGIARAIESCKRAGITPVMISGDHPATARAIAEQVGICKPGDLLLEGRALDQLSEAEFEQVVEQVCVYARVVPEQKLRIVQALQRKGHYTAMTGDGINDAPSLKAATIGIAMGKNGTDVSREAAHLVLLDDNFSTLVTAIKEGRRIVDNIIKFIKYILTCNGAEIWVIAMAPFLGLPIPLLPIHILWINLVTDGLPALALASEKSEQDSMVRSPRHPNQSLFSHGVAYHILWVGILMAAITLGTQSLAISQGWHSQTMVFSVLSFSQLGHVFAIRSDRTFLYRQGFLSNKPLFFAVSFTLLLQMAVIYLPFFNALFKTEALSWMELGTCLAFSLMVFHAVELEKWVRNKWYFLKTSPSTQ